MSDLIVPFWIIVFGAYVCGYWHGATDGERQSRSLSRFAYTLAKLPQSAEGVAGLIMAVIDIASTSARTTQHP